MTQDRTFILTIRGEDLAIQPGQIHQRWRDAAEAKGYRVVARIKDKNNLALECTTCGGLHVCRYFVLQTFQPDCPNCIEARWRVTAELAGLKMLHRDLRHRHYAVYEAPCGHQIRRQFTFIERMARGETDARCETCHLERERDEARAQGWNLIGPDPQGDRNYRLYRHTDGCNAQARIARANMQTGRFTCPGCGESWATEPSYLYAMRFELEPGKFAIKVGFSRNPDSRLLHQLHRQPDLPRMLLKKVPIRSGRHAQRLEKRLHKWLVQRFPDTLIPPEEFTHLLKVKSELYRPGVETAVLSKLARIARKEARAATRSRTQSRARSKRLRRAQG
ncbi:GIY-YIG nuclease family protein [Thioclava indica]|uniref:GIY-YIG domain-containing protein n=1 Tax=Thioclava indica TaxID=1353528 RepID=A0A074JM69_9RHOB|nr:GIY-YIG nuclease family protein [Thioclava indica]KEO56658.1 hypothetical protein DT23_17730 [Thioclava indica]